MLSFAEATGANILSESYHDFQPYPLSLPAGKTTVEQALDNLLLGDRTWWKKGSIYLIQKRFSFLDRRYQVDEALIKRLKETKKKRGFSLEEWGELGLLSIEQWKGLEGLGLGEFQMHLGLQPLMAFYGHLRDGQRTDLLTKSGIDGRRFGKEDLVRLRHWVSASETNGALFPPEEQRGIIRVGASIEEYQTVFRVWIIGSDGNPRLLREQSISAIPRSMWPKEEEKQSEMNAQPSARP